LAAASGILLALSFPKPGVSLLAWFALVPLLLAAAGKSPRSAGALGFVAGCTAYAGIMYWVNIVMVTYGRLPLAASIALYLVLVAYLALYPALVLWLMRRSEERGISPIWSFPILWVAGELIRSFLLTGFPWALLGYSQYRTLPLIQISDLTGVYGVSFLVACTNVVLYRVWQSLRNRRVPYPVTGVLTLLLLVAASLGYGLFTLTRSEVGTQQRVLLVQGNIPQDVKWNPAFAEKTVATYERLSRQGAQGPGTLVVWPESALPFFLSLIHI
jgi:apolipoprotein N-acyltransferase